MLGVGNADLERALILVVLVTIGMMLANTLTRTRSLLAPQVPPTVAPLLHPRDEEVRELRHWRAQMEQIIPDLTTRVVRHEEQIKAVRGDLDEIKHATKRSEHMLNLLVEHGLKEARE